MVRLRKIATVKEYGLHFITPGELKRIQKQTPKLKVVMTCLAVFFLLTLPAFAQEGKASWYSVEACKYNTSPFCPVADGTSLYQLEAKQDLFCASNDYPLGTMLRVTNLKNGKSVLVKVRDRGGFEKYDRIIDLGKLAFEKIGNTRAGIIRVRVEKEE